MSCREEKIFVFNIISTVRQNGCSFILHVISTEKVVILKVLCQCTKRFQSCSLAKSPCFKIQKAKAPQKGTLPLSFLLSVFFLLSPYNRAYKLCGICFDQERILTKKLPRIKNKMKKSITCWIELWFYLPHCSSWPSSQFYRSK